MTIFGKQCVVIAIDAKRNHSEDSTKQCLKKMAKNSGLRFSFMVENKKLD